MSRAVEAVNSAGRTVQRLDKWLWFARVAKTRTQAASLVTEGKIRVNSEKVAKPGLSVRVGDVITCSARKDVRILKIKDLGESRGSAPAALLLFEDLTPPKSREAIADERASALAARAPGLGRPTKRDRRQIDRLIARDPGD